MMPILIPIITVVAGAAAGVIFNWLVGRGRESREVNEDERADESQDAAIQRGVANDALERSKVAYSRLDAAEQKTADAESRMASLSSKLAGLTSDYDTALQEISRLKLVVANQTAELEQLNIFNRLLTARVTELENGHRTGH